MLRILKVNWSWLLLATGLILFASTLFPGWVLMLSVWFGLFFLFRLTNLEAQLLNAERLLYLAIAWFYPLVETGIKWMILHKVIPDSWIWVNRLEHFCWAMVIVILLSPIFANLWKKLPTWQTLLFVVGLICLLGNLNEFLEYFQRSKASLAADLSLANYYGDTIYDMIMNILGGLVGFAALQWSRQIRIS